MSTSGITAPSAFADSAPNVTVLPEAPRFSPRATSILNAGETGYLLAQEGDNRLLWIDYATGSATPLAVTLPVIPRYDFENGWWDYPQPGLNIQGGGYYGDGSDTVALYSATPAPHVTLQKGAGAVFADLVLPEGQSYVGTFGDTVLTRTGEADAPTGYHLLRYEAGQVTDTPITGFPEGAVLGGLEDGDATSLILRYKDSTGGWGRWVLVDLSDGVAKPLPDRPVPDDPWNVRSFRLGAGTILRDGSHLLDRAAPHAVLRTVDTGFVSYDATIVPVGTGIVAVQRQNAGDNEYRGSELWSVPREGEGLAPPVLRQAYAQVVLAPDGTALVAGAKTAEDRGDIDWAVHRLVPTADGGVETHRVRTVDPMPAHVYGLSLGSGILTTAENSTYYQPGDYYGVYRSTWLSSTGQPQSVRTTVDGLLRTQNCSAVTSERCVSLRASGDGFHGQRTAADHSGYTLLHKNGESGWGPRIDTDGDRVEDLSGRFGVTVTGVTGDSPSLVEFKPPTGGTVVRRTDAALAAVWGSTVWSAAEESATITSQTLPSGAAGASFTTPNACVPTELQAAGRWVYWSCEDSEWGPEAGSGVYDRLTKRTMRVPGRNIRNVLLADGYLVRQSGEGLRLFDLHAGLPATGSVPQRVVVSAADLGSKNKPQLGWTVDRFGGHIAYAGDDQRVRIVGTGVPAPAVSVIDSVVGGSPFNVATATPRWSGIWWTSKPTGAWSLSLKESATGAVVRTVSGAEARGRIDATWDGRNASGQLVRNGTYVWTVTAKPADGVGADLTVTGSVTVTGGAPAPKPLPAWRDLSGDGSGDLLALTPAGALTVRTGTGTGGLGTGASATGWPSTSMAVPFGDLSGDGCNDVLVRSAAGVLSRYDGGCGKAFAPGGPRLTIGSGWQVYNALTAPGDLTGDGRTDLLARTPAGELWMYAADGAGKFKGRVKLGAGWQAYNVLVGTGDLNGDKAGDLLARDAAGVLWRYYGDGKGALGGRVKVGGGWQAYNALAGVGDITGDGRADLVARDAAGVLWRYTGTGVGTFSTRVRVGGGWQMYKMLF
ncbi:FG-GAP-like repeat-containing protein [Streptomyces sp. NPDC013489]|uniref:FG-GAP-like repeat-containing protein n=1 Tax=Streptomyces sp. NPDC013489 TaxID=3155606 RepID=UPI0033CFBADB